MDYKLNYILQIVIFLFHAHNVDKEVTLVRLIRTKIEEIYYNHYFSVHWTFWRTLFPSYLIWNMLEMVRQNLKFPKDFPKICQRQETEEKGLNTIVNDL